jgi:hypothetical protein
MKYSQVKHSRSGIADITERTLYIEQGLEMVWRYGGYSVHTLPACAWSREGGEQEAV